MLSSAKRALIVGDPRQPTPVVDLPEEEDRAERARADLSSTWLVTRKLTYREHPACDSARRESPRRPEAGWSTRPTCGTGITVRRGATVAGHTADLVVSRAGVEAAVVVDDPGGDPGGRVLRKALAQLDIVGGRMPAHRVPAWQCLVEPERVVAKPSERLQQL